MSLLVLKTKKPPGSERLTLNLRLFYVIDNRLGCMLSGASLRFERSKHMGKVPAFHSKREADPKVYHDNDRCTEGNNIERQNRVSGTGGRPRCKHCDRLS
jgi:hypothetical protein